MDKLIRAEIESGEYEFSVKDPRILREQVGKIEEKLRQFEFNNNDGNFLEPLWNRLIELSVKMRNVNLALLITAKMNLIQLTLLIKSTIQLGDSVSEFVAIAYIRNHFHLDSPCEFELQSLPTTERDLSLNSHRRILQIHLDQCDWQSAFGYIEKNLLESDPLRELLNQLVRFNMAESNEIDENYQDSLIDYEESRFETSHCIRLFLKNRLSMALNELIKYYSLEKTSANGLWAQFSSLICTEGVGGKFGKTSSNEDLGTLIKYNYNGNAKFAENEFFKLIPGKLRSFINSTESHQEHFGGVRFKRNVDFISSLTSSLKLNLQVGLAELAAQYLASKQTSKASSSLLCLKQYGAFMSLLVRESNLNVNLRLQLACDFGTPGELMLNLFSYLKEETLNDFSAHNGQKFRSSQKSNLSERTQHLENETTASNSAEQLMFALLKLGLLNETMQVLSINSSLKNQTVLEQVENHLNQLIGHRQLDRIDPIIERPTLELLLRSMLKINDQITNTSVITITVLSTTIFLHKFKTFSSNNEKPTEEIGRVGENLDFIRLEFMFQIVTKYLNSMKFSASDCLVNATNLLIFALKEKLDYSIVCESEPIRSSFQQIIDLIATKCMIESQYKKAATLYGHIEDNVNAIKCLMRMGDVEIVINYSLLVKNITVNRLTINYLKHLQAEPSVIEEFISKSKL